MPGSSGQEFSRCRGDILPILGGCLPPTSNVAARFISPGLVGSISALVEYMFRGCRIEADRNGKFEELPLLAPPPLSLGFSFSGGGVGGNTFLLMTGGAL